ncbi:hypothetical protein [Absidia glauca]|uniref:Uncharacterized protein n=1 Tax=Absidia glauca TaxID=4829 RepID=A0A163TI75_ABSGL|nr:hypothetical protein [Absidia glauca]
MVGGSGRPAKRQRYHSPSPLASLTRDVFSLPEQTDFDSAQEPDSGPEAALQYGATQYLYTTHTFPPATLKYSLHVLQTIAGIQGLQNAEQCHIRPRGPQLHFTMISKKRSILVASIRDFVWGFDISDGSKVDVLKHIVKRGRFPFAGFDDTQPYFTSTLFKECFYRTSCVKHGKTTKLALNHINKASISLIFCILCKECLSERPQDICDDQDRTVTTGRCLLAQQRL